jgi:hypothetical protein
MADTGEEAFPKTRSAIVGAFLIKAGLDEVGNGGGDRLSFLLGMKAQLPV